MITPLPTREFPIHRSGGPGGGAALALKAHILELYLGSFYHNCAIGGIPENRSMGVGVCFYIDDFLGSEIE